MEKTNYLNKDLHARSGSLSKMTDYNFSSDLLQIKPVLPPRRLHFKQQMYPFARSLSDESKDSRYKVKEAAIKKQRSKNISLHKKSHSFYDQIQAIDTEKSQHDLSRRQDETLKNYSKLMRSLSFENHFKSIETDLKGLKVVQR